MATLTLLLDGNGNLLPAPSGMKWAKVTDKATGFPYSLVSIDSIYADAYKEAKEYVKNLTNNQTGSSGTSKPSYTVDDAFRAMEMEGIDPETVNLDSSSFNQWLSTKYPNVATQVKNKIKKIQAAKTTREIEAALEAMKAKGFYPSTVDINASSFNEWLFRNYPGIANQVKQEITRIQANTGGGNTVEAVLRAMEVKGFDPETVNLNSSSFNEWLYTKYPGLATQVKKEIEKIQKALKGNNDGNKGSNSGGGNGGGNSGNGGGGNKNNNTTVEDTSTPTTAEPETEPEIELHGYASDSDGTDRSEYEGPIGESNGAFAIPAGAQTWGSGGTSTPYSSETLPSTTGIETQEVETDAFSGDGEHQTPSYELVTTDAPLHSVQLDEVLVGKYQTAWQNQDKKSEMLNRKRSIIQNNYGFPVWSSSSDDMLADKYNYQIIPNDPHYSSGPIGSLEDNLTKLRAALGIPVHGNNQIAKAMKYYMYNRFKVPDTNNAFNKMTTHVFFTRPDLNLLKANGHDFIAEDQVMNHTEAAMIWRRQPELFKLLTDYTRCGDSNNFNMLLSNQVSSFDIQDEQLSTNRAGKSWNEYEMVYGDCYSGRTASEFSCNFTDTNELAIIQLMKLWITYIDNVARGAWRPSYNLYDGAVGANASHMYTKTLDYASSVYVFKCGPDGEDVLYWSKYYGVFPVNTGANILSWDLTTPIGDPPKLNIKFAYSYKRDMSPISLIEFNHVANVPTNVKYVPAFDTELGHCARPYVGAPYIEMKLGSPTQGLVSGDINRSYERTQIRLKFRKDDKSTNDRDPRGDKMLFQSNLTMDDYKVRAS